MESISIMLAEEDPRARRDLRAALEALGHRVVGEAEDGPRALSLIRALRPGLAILGAALPQMSGLEVARLVRGEHLSPVVLLTASVDNGLLREANAAGVFACLCKPAFQVDLPAAIVIATGRYREQKNLEEEVAILKGKMESRKIVGRAKALLMERHNLTEREAFHRIQAQSQNLQKPPHEIAQAIITASEIAA